MIFCHLAKSQSIRDIAFGLRSATGNLNHLGIKQAPSKSSISYQNKHRKSDLFRDIYYALLTELSQKARLKQRRFRIKSKIYLLDSTLISLSISLFDWAHYKHTKGAVKLHTLLDYDGVLPAFINITDGKTADKKGAADIPISPNSVIVGDRYYNDFQLLHNWDSTKAFFVVRHKENLQYERVKENTLPDNRHQHIRIDEIDTLKGSRSSQRYPGKLCRVAVYDAEKKRTIELLTNNFSWTANTISELYKARWQIEIFFKEIKQLLKIKTFIGTSANAVEIQIWTAMITLLLLKYLKYISEYTWHLSNLVGFIRLNLFVKILLYEWLNNPFKDYDIIEPNLQLNLFEGG